MQNTVKLTASGLDAVLSSTCDRIVPEDEKSESMEQLKTAITESKVFPEYVKYAATKLAGVDKYGKPVRKLSDDELLIEFTTLIAQALLFGTMWERSRAEAEQMERSFNNDGLPAETGRCGVDGERAESTERQRITDVPSFGVDVSTPPQNEHTGTGESGVIGN